MQKKNEFCVQGVKLGLFGHLEGAIWKLNCIFGMKIIMSNHRIFTSRLCVISY